MDVSTNRSIVVVGSCMVDFVCYAERLPKEGETIHGNKFVTNFGGKGANQAVAAAKLGGQTTMIARLGDDLWADKYIENLKSYSIDTSFVSKTPNFASGIAQITVSDLGSNQIVIVAGANSQLNSNDLLLAKELIKEASVLVCQLETSEDVALEAMELCEGVTILNGAPALAKFNSKLLSVPKIFCVNESEAEVFSGVKVISLDDGKEALKVLLSKGCQSVILTMGSQGALYGDTPNSIYHAKTAPVKCVDSTGAGDAFIGALAYLISVRHGNLVKCIETACLIAADSVKRPGTQISFSKGDILEDILRD